MTNVASRVSWICGIAALALAIPSVGITYSANEALATSYSILLVTAVAGVSLLTYIELCLLAIVFAIIGLKHTPRGSRRAAGLALAFGSLLLILIVAALPAVGLFLGLAEQS